MTKVTFLGCLLLLLCLRASSADKNCRRTPMNLEMTFLSECMMLVMSSDDICSRAWTAFSGGFSGIDPESVNESNYEAYFDVFPIDVMPNMSLFWTKTGPLVNLLSMMNAMGVSVVSSMTDSLVASALINKIAKRQENGYLNWCGNESGIDFKNDCLCSVTLSFWSLFSMEFAMAASGSIFYLADGQDAKAFRNDSFFATSELPFLVDKNVTQLIAMVIHEKGKGESCSGMNSSIQMLRERVTNREFDFQCYDLYGRVSDSTQSQTLVECVQTVVNNVQKGTEGSVRQILCSGTTTLQVSVLVLLITMLIHHF